MVAFLAFVPITINVATQIATRTIGKKALEKAITTYGKPFIQTLQNIGKNKDKISKTVKKFNETNKKLEKKTKIEKKKVKTKKIDKEKKIKKKKIDDKKITTKTKKAVSTLTANTVKDIKNIASVLNKLTLGSGGKVASAGGKLVTEAAKRPVTTAIGTYAGVKAIDAGTKLFQGGNNKKTTDISNEVTGGGTTTSDTKTTPQVSGAGSGGTVYDRFVSAHNSAMDSNQSSFEFDGKVHYVGPSRLQGI